MATFKLVQRSETGRLTFTGVSVMRQYAQRMVLVFVAAVTMVTSTILTSSPASAAYEIPVDTQSTKYPRGLICVRSALNPTYYPVAAIAQQWNVAVNNPEAAPLALDFSTDCVADHYPAESMLTVGTFNNPNHGACLAFTNTSNRWPAEDRSGMYHWTNGVGVYINVGIPSCVSTAQRRSHQVAAGIGYALGLRIMTTSGYANRVMCTCSLDTVRSPDSTSAHRVHLLYRGYYGG